MLAPPIVKSVVIAAGPARLQALLGMPPHPKGLVIFAHGSGSGRLSPRNHQVAAALREAGFATLLLDLLTPREEAIRANIFDIALLATRLEQAVYWAAQLLATRALPIGLFGASTGAGAALLAAAHLNLAQSHRIVAIVSRGGRPDLAAAALAEVTVPTQLIVGSLDAPVIALNTQAQKLLRGPVELVIIPGAGHLFEEAGTMEQVIEHAINWFDHYLTCE